MVSTVPCTFKDCLCIIYDKEWELEKETKVNSEVLLIKSSGIILIFLPAFYLIIWLMTHQRFFLKIAILKI